MKHFVLIIGLLTGSIFSFGQSAQLKEEALLTSQKWTCMEVSRKKLEKMEFKFEMGNKMQFTIDKKFQYQNNDMNYMSGEWKLDKKTLYLFYLNSEGTNRKEVASYKILKLKEGVLSLKRLERPNGKLYFK